MTNKCWKGTRQSGPPRGNSSSPCRGEVRTVKENKPRSLKKYSTKKLLHPPWPACPKQRTQPLYGCDPAVHTMIPGCQVLKLKKQDVCSVLDSVGFDIQRQAIDCEANGFAKDGLRSHSDVNRRPTTSYLPLHTTSVHGLHYAVEYLVDPSMLMCDFNSKLNVLSTFPKCCDKHQWQN